MSKYNLDQFRIYMEKIIKLDSFKLIIYKFNNYKDIIIDICLEHYNSWLPEARRHIFEEGRLSREEVVKFFEKDMFEPFAKCIFVSIISAKIYSLNNFNKYGTYLNIDGAIKEQYTSYFLDENIYNLDLLIIDKYLDIACEELLWDKEFSKKVINRSFWDLIHNIQNYQFELSQNNKSLKGDIIEACPNIVNDFNYNIYSIMGCKFKNQSK